MQNFNLRKVAVRTALIGICTFFVFWSLGILSPLNKLILESKSFESLAASFSELSLLQNISKFALLPAIEAYWVWWKSLLGSFNWGHTYYPLYYCGLISVTFALLCWRGVYSFVDRFGPRSASIASILIALGWLAQSIAILSAVLIPLDADAVSLESFLKARLTAPGIALVLVPALFGYIALWNDRRFKIWLFRGIGFWTLSLMLYFLPLVLLKDLY